MSLLAEFMIRLGIAATIPLQANQPTSPINSYNITGFNHTSNQYYGVVGFGTPPQNLRVVFDTGSHVSYLRVKNCTLCNTDGRTMYDPSNSSTLVRIGDPYDMVYGYGMNNQNYCWTSLWGKKSPLHMHGQKVMETMTFGGYTIPNVTLFLVDSQGTGFADDLFDGVVAMPDLEIENINATENEVNDLNQLFPNATKQFGYYVGPKESGQVTFTGDFNMNVLGSNIIWTPNYDDPLFGFFNWKVQLSEVYINGENINNDVMFATLNTGVSNIYAPKHIVEAIYKPFDNVKPYYDSNDSYTGMYTFPCTTPPTNFELVLQIGGSNFTIPKDEFNLGIFSKTADNVTCQAILNALPESESSYWILGNSFFKHNFALFDWDKHQIGLAPHT